VNPTDQFRQLFRALTGQEPFLWHVRLFLEFLEARVPELVQAPTAAGKTRIMLLWLIALVLQVRMGKTQLPRRLVFIVNRRAVVDEASEEVLAIRARLNDPQLPADLEMFRDTLRSLCIDSKGECLAISTLRGELADNREWEADPARPTIIVGTPDMTGSKLLFSGYGMDWSWTRAHRAGLLGHDALWIHDEFQLCPAFSTLLRSISQVQEKNLRPIQLCNMSATPPPPTGSCGGFRLTEEELREPLVHRRFFARKGLRLKLVDDVHKEMLASALGYQGAQVRVGIYVSQPDQAQKLAQELGKKLAAPNRVALLTGTMRSHERDRLVCNEVLLAMKADPTRIPVPETVYLVATSAGEIGVNFDFDHELSDLTTLEYVVQRAGRDNRLGRDDPNFVSEVTIFRSKVEKKEDLHKNKTWELLHRLPKIEDGEEGVFNASPSSLLEILGAADATEAYEEPARVLPLTDTVMETLALTSVRGPCPGKFHIAPYLHGVEGRPPDVVVVWRAEVDRLAHLSHPDIKTGTENVQEWFEKHPIRTREKLTEPAGSLVKKLGASTVPGDFLKRTAILIDSTGAVSFVPLRELTDKKRAAARLAAATLVIPADAGGLRLGMFDPNAVEPVDDVADLTSDPRRARVRLLGDRTGDERWQFRVLGEDLPWVPAATTRVELEAAIHSENLEQLHELTLREDDNGPNSILLSLRYARSLDIALDTSSKAVTPQTLRDHLRWTGQVAERLHRRLGLPESLAQALVVACVEHDQGKDRACWQAGIGHPKTDNSWEPLAKSGNRKSTGIGYRHEFGSLLDAAGRLEQVAEADRDLAFHLIASHHGRARPHFRPADYDPESKVARCDKEAQEVIRRYVRCQQRYGIWGLAWLEALLKSSDVIATILAAGVEELPR
jgi:CRISPR-associated endonuclease/helicase Cas3